MNHLTTTQIMQFSDGTADFATQAACTNHLAVCARCRTEIGIQKSLLLAGRKMPLTSPSDGFSRRILRSVVPKAASRISAWLLNNMGGMFGMMMVLGVIGYFVSTPGILQSTASETQSTRIVRDLQQSLDNGYSWIQKGINDVRGNKGNTNEEKNGTEKVILISLIGIGILGLADRYLLRPIFTRAR